MDYKSQIIKNMANMTEWQKNKMVRLAIRLANKDPKALKLIDLWERGFISTDHLLNAV